MALERCLRKLARCTLHCSNTQKHQERVDTTNQNSKGSFHPAVHCANNNNSTKQTTSCTWDPRASQILPSILPSISNKHRQTKTNRPSSRDAPHVSETPRHIETTNSLPKDATKKRVDTECCSNECKTAHFFFASHAPTQDYTAFASHAPRQRTTSIAQPRSNTARHNKKTPPSHNPLSYDRKKK